MKQLILVEGLPGTGKTTVTQRLSEYLLKKNQTVVTLFEGNEQIPCDFYEIAGMPTEEFEFICNRHPEIKENLPSVFLRTKNYVYLRLNSCPDYFSTAFRKWDMGDELNPFVSVAHYISCTIERVEHWVSANLENENIVIIDSGFLQNPINELLFRGASDDDICYFVQSIAEKFSPLNPFCFYLKRESAETAISFAKQAKGPDWSARVDAMLLEVNRPDLFHHRFELELKLLPCISHSICFVRGNDWSDVDSQIDKHF